MTGRIDAERILDAFLAPEPDRLPDRVLDAAFAEIARTQQRRALRVPWRFPFMPARSRATAAAVAVVAAVAVGGALYLMGTGPQPPGGPTRSLTPSPSPSVSADLLDVSTWTTFTSSRYGFSVKYPPTFAAVPSAFFWRLPNAAGNTFDGFHSGGAVKWLDGVSMQLPGGVTQDDWHDEYRRDVVEDDLPWEPESCFAPRESWSSTTVDGQAAELRVGCEALEAFVFIADRVYVFSSFAYEGASAPTTEVGVTDEHRDLFELWLTTITLDPLSAQEPPFTPTQAPSST